MKIETLILTIAATCALAVGSVSAQPDTNKSQGIDRPNKTSKPARKTDPYGLGRINGMPTPYKGETLSSSEINEVDLSATDPVAALDPSNQRKAGIEYLDIPGNGNWSAKLGESRDKHQYVTFTLYASVGTIIDVGNALLRVAMSERAGFISLEYKNHAADNVRWSPLDVDIQLARFEGREMAMLNMITVKLDQPARMWSFGLGQYNVQKTDLPLASRKNTGANEIRVVAGSDGVWVLGVLSSDQNPMFEDTNHNTIPDEYEIEQLGAILGSEASGDETASLLNEWKEDRFKRTDEVFLDLVPPDQG